MKITNCKNTAIANNDSAKEVMEKDVFARACRCFNSEGT